MAKGSKMERVKEELCLLRADLLQDPAAAFVDDRGRGIGLGGEPGFHLLLNGVERDGSRRISLRLIGDGIKRFKIPGVG